MAAKALVTGAIANPELRHTQQGKAVLELRINGTASERDRQTNQWADLGEPLWVSATFWEEEAERLAAALTKGDRVSVEGTLVIESYQRRDGSGGTKHVLRFPRFLGVIPRKNTGPSQAQATYTQPSADPWGGPAAAAADANDPLPPF